jgi:hypothetical protein
MIGRLRRKLHPEAYCTDCPHPHDRHTHYGCDQFDKRQGRLYECPCTNRYYRLDGEQLICQCDCYLCRYAGSLPERHCSRCPVGQHVGARGEISTPDPK